MAMGKYLRRHRWSRETICGVAAILGQEGPSTATYFAADGPRGPILGGLSVA